MTRHASTADLARLRAATVRARVNLAEAREQRNRYGGVHAHRGAYQAAFERAEQALADAEAQERKAQETSA